MSEKVRILREGKGNEEGTSREMVVLLK